MILHPISFNLAPARVLGVVGSNRTGKTTLLKLLYRYEAPTTGTIRIDGTDIWSISAREVARTVTAVLQEQPTYFALTLREIVALGRTPHRKGFGGADGARYVQIVQSALDRLCLLEFADRQLDTLLGGERQRVTVARALAQLSRLFDPGSTYQSLRYSSPTRGACADQRSATYHRGLTSRPEHGVRRF